MTMVTQRTHFTRRQIMTALMLPLAARTVAANPTQPPKGKRVTETYDTAANFNAITQHWPDGRDPPELLSKVAAYMRDQEWGSLGYVQLTGDRLDDYWIENGVDCWPQFGTFMHLPDGSRVAVWFRDDAPPGPAPIVLIGSEGEQRIEAPSLEAFLANWALSSFDDKGDLVAGGYSTSLPSDLIRGEDDDVADGRPAFAKFLEATLGQPLTAVSQPAPPSAPFEAFFTAWGERARREILADPTLRAIAQKLDAYIPRGKDPWERVSFQVNAAGSRIEIGGPKGPKSILPEEADVIPLVLKAREARAQGGNAVRGLWHSAQILLLPDGACRIAADWEAEPKFRDGTNPSATDLAADLARFPRSSRWMEDWLRKRK